jgi:hypothetical protein
MSYTIKKNKKIDLKIPEFLCDSYLSENLAKYDMLNHMNNYNFTAMIGKPGSGKTSLLVSFLSGTGKNKVLRKIYNNILVIMPSSSIKSMKNNIFKKHDEDKMFNELDFDTINEIKNRLDEYTKENESTLIIMDDVGAELKNIDIQKILRQIIYNRRHLKCSIIMLCQSFLSIPREIRKLINNAIMFKPSKIEFENFIHELFEQKKDKIIDLLQLYKNKGDYLFLNVESQRIYKMFDEIIFYEDN